MRNLITSHEEKAGHIACLQDRWLTRDVPLNADAVSVLRGELGKHPQFCFTYRGNPIKWDLTNTAWENALQKAGIENLLFHDLRHTWASWRRQSGTSTDEL